MSDYARWADDLDDREYPDDDENDDESDTKPCPHCGESTYEDAEQCPSCGQYLTFSTSPWSNRPGWWIALAAAGIAAVLALLAFGWL